MPNITKYFNTPYVKLLMVMVFIGAALVICRYAKKNMYYDLDTVLYTACALENRTSSPKEIHDLAYGLAKKELGIAKFQSLIDSSKSYRYSIYKSPEHFYSQLPFYKVKPLYVYALKLGRFFGFSPVLFSTCINLVAYLSICFLVLCYLAYFIGFYKGWLISLCLMLMPMVLDTIKNNTPDMLSALCILSAMMFVLSDSGLKRHTAIGFFCLSVFVRPENVMLSIVFCGIVLLNKSREYSLNYLLLLFCGPIICYLLVCFHFESYPWSLLYKHSFTGYIPDLKNTGTELTFREYIYGFRFIPSTVFYSDFFLVLLFLILPFLMYPQYTHTRLFMMMQAVFVTILIRVMLFPDLSVRFYTGFFLISAILFFRILLGKEEVQAVNNFNSN